MRPTWSDFSSERGFNDGRQLGPEDVIARTALIARLKDLPEIQRDKIAVLPYSETHANACRILLIENPEGLTDDEVLARWLAGRAFTINGRVSGLEDGRMAFAFQALDESGYPAWTIEWLINDVYDAVLTTMAQAPAPATTIQPAAVIDTPVDAAPIDLPAPERVDETDVPDLIALQSGEDPY